MLISDLIAALTDIARDMGDADIGFQINGKLVTDMAHLNVRILREAAPCHEVPRPSAPVSDDAPRLA